MTGSHEPYGKKFIKPLKNTNGMRPQDVMPLNDKDLTPSTTSGQENNAFQLCFKPMFPIEEASPQFSGRFL